MRRQPSTVHRGQPLLTSAKSNSPSSSAFSSPAESAGGTRIGEVAGGTAAGCAALCCCCPCLLLNILFMTVYKVPAGLCRLAWQKKRRRRQVSRKGLLPRPEGKELRTRPTAAAAAEGEKVVVSAAVTDDHAVQLEKEMLDKFCGSGFWRSPSQREVTCNDFENKFKEAHLSDSKK